MGRECPHCDRELPSRKALDDHVDRAHPEAEAPSSGGSWWILGVLVALALAAVVGAMVLGGGGADSEFHIEQSPHTGDLDAPVKLVAFESPACTSCRLFHIERGGDPSTFDQLHDRFVATGQVTYVEKFARAGYGWDRVGANAQKCAWNLGGWEAFHGLTQGYYEERSRISGDNAGSFALSWARDSPTVDASAFRSCFEDKRYDEEISRDLGDGRAAGAQSTPTFIVVAPDGSQEKIVGPQPVETFTAKIQQALAKQPDDARDTDANGSSSGDGNATDGGSGSS